MSNFTQCKDTNIIPNRKIKRKISYQLTFKNKNNDKFLISQSKVVSLHEITCN